MSLETREFQVRAVNTEARTFTGLAVPWDTDTQIGDSYTERLARGAVIESDDAKIFWRHEEPIGRIIAARDTVAGWEIEGRLSQTPRGDEAYTLLRDGVIDRLSIGFEPIEHTEQVDEATGALTVIRTKVRVHEVSLVPFPAYPDAAISAVRSASSQVREADNPTFKESPMTDTVTRADLTEVRTLIEDLDRKVDALPGERVAVEHPLANYRSFGDYVKAVASGDDAAMRAYAGITSEDLPTETQWVARVIDIVRKPQVIASIFARGPLPATGMSVDTLSLDTDTIQVATQAAEGDDLAFGKLSFKSGSATVTTLGGWTSMSRQVIERSSVPVVTTAFEALAERYGQAVESYARALLTATLAATTHTMDGALDTQDDVIGTVIDLAEKFTDNGRSLDGLLVDKETFKSLYAIAATDRILQVSGQATDKVGALTVNVPSANVAGLNVQILPGAAAGTVAAYDRSALKLLESSGAPFRLQDQNIVNLTGDFSVYGYLTGFVVKPNGLVKVTLA